MGVVDIYVLWPPFPRMICTEPGYDCAGALEKMFVNNGYIHVYSNGSGEGSSLESKCFKNIASYVNFVVGN